MTPRIAASVMCADQLRLASELRLLEEAGVDMLHIDVMDGDFVPNITLGLQTCRDIRAATRLPVDYHLLARRPNWLVDELPMGEGDCLSVHIESGCDLAEASQSVRARGARFGLALNPATCVEEAASWLEAIDYVNLMMIEPGFAGRPMVPGAMEKIAGARRLLDGRGHEATFLEVDGNVSFRHAPEMRARGADLFVAGSSSLFAREMSLPEATKRLRAAISGVG